MSIGLVVTGGFGNGTFNGTITDVVLRGYGIGEEIITPDDFLSVYGFVDTAGENIQGVIAEGTAFYADAGYFVPDYVSDGFDGGQTVLGTITAVHTLYGQIDSSGETVQGLIDETGLSVEGEI